MRRLASILLVFAVLSGNIPVAAASADVASSSSPGPLALKGRGLQTRGAIAAAPGVLAPLAADVLDAVPLPASPVHATLPTQGQSRLYAVELAAGERLSISLTGTSGIFDAYLFAPGLGLLADATAIAHASEGAYPREFAYDVPLDISGTYYLEIYAYDGAGAYDLEWAVTPAAERARKDIDKAVSVGLPVDRTVTLADALQSNEILRFYVAGGRRVRIDVAGPADADFDAYLYAPGTQSVLPSYVSPLAWGDGGSANESFVYDVPVGSAGLYALEIIRFTGSGDARVRITQESMPAAPAATRVSGADRFATAVEVSKKTHPAGSATAVLCSGRSFPDGLAASSLAGALDAPIMLTEPGSLPASVGSRLAAMGTRTVYVIGGTAAVGFAVESALARYIPGVTIIRVAGASRYETAGEVADWVHGILGQRPDRVFVASGVSFPDALALSPVAYATHTPILLTVPDALPASTRAAIERVRGTSSHKVDVMVAGGPVAVSDAAAQAARTAAGGTLTRAAGPDRYATALAIAETAIFAGWSAPEHLAVASGVTFPDSLAGAALPGAAGGVLLLCPVSVLGPSSSAFVRSFDFRIDEAWALGGVRAVADPVLYEIRTILPDTPHAQ